MTRIGKGRPRPPLPRHIRRAVIARDGLDCALCGRITIEGGGTNPLATEIDHKRPVARGGTDDLDNLRVACRECNNARNDSMYEEFPLTDEERERGRATLAALAEREAAAGRLTPEEAAAMASLFDEEQED